MKPAVLPLLLAVCSAPTLALNICTDAEGQVSYQQQACPALTPQVANQRVMSSSLDPQGARLVVDRFYSALSARDAQAAQQHLAQRFINVLNSSAGVQRRGREQYMGAMRPLLNAASSYDFTVLSCGPAVPEGARLNLDCQIGEHAEYLKRKGSDTNRQQLQVGIENGQVKIFRMETTRETVRSD